MSKITLQICLPLEEGSMLNEAHLAKTWHVQHRSPLKHHTIPHTGDKCYELAVATEGRSDWCISFECETEICYKTKSTCIIAQKEVHISCLGKGIANVPSRNFKWVLDAFVTALLKDGWTDEGNNFEHLKPE
jgi:hypothetical protein